MVKLTAEEAFELGNRIRDAAVALHRWRIENRDRLSRSQWEELDNREVTLLNFASSNFTNGIGMRLDSSQISASRLEGSVKHAASAIEHIQSFKQVLDLASALALFAGAVASGNVAEIPAGIVALEDALSAIDHPNRPQDDE
ncbi:MAG TPA: hypothetical protein VFI43_00875 [Nitrosospira sp.]|nr:hypothetical protein [Nitrosospira sp.]